MYHRVALNGKSSLQGQSVLDLGCGRGGGLGFLCDHFELEEAVGIDICARSIQYAKD